MAADKFDVKRFFASPLAVAAVARADDVFGFLARAVRLPPGVSALVTRDTGDLRVCPAGGEVSGEGATEIMFARTEPVELSWVEERITSEDKFQADAHIHMRATLAADPGELSSFRTQIMGSNNQATVENLVQYLRHGTRPVLADFAGQRKMGTLADDQDRAQLIDTFTGALAGPCFAAGLTADSAVAIRFESPTFHQVRVSQEQAARRHTEHAAQRRLQQAIEAAQSEHLQHLEGLLAKLQKLAEASPDVELGNLARTFSESERGELYDALFAGPAKERHTQWVVVAAGTELLLYDPSAPNQPVRTVEFGGEAGAVRSVQSARGPDGRLRLLAGAARGVYEIIPETDAAPSVFQLDASTQVRGGVNSVALVGERVLASHSEVGLICWQRDNPAWPVMLLEELTKNARAVRGVLFHNGKVCCSVDDKVLIASADQPTESNVRTLAEPGAADSVVTALCPGPDGLYTGRADGRVLHWPEGDAAPTQLHTGNNRPVESLHLLDVGGIRRLFFTDTSVAVHARVLGDSFTCRYEAGGQTLRRVEVASDLVVATNEVRDRLILWSPSAPASPKGIIPIGQQTGHSVQDVCLLPIG